MRASPVLEMTSDSEGEMDVDGTIQGLQPTAKYKSKSGSSKKFPANLQIPTQVPGKDLQTFVLWHCRLAHASPLVVRKFLQSNYTQVPLPPVDSLPFCDICTRTKLTKNTFDKVRTVPTIPEENILADLIGPISPETSPMGLGSP